MKWLIVLIVFMWIIGASYLFGVPQKIADWVNNKPKLEEPMRIDMYDVY